jgi:DNA-binding MarR family transcriptional regulator
MSTRSAGLSARQQRAWAALLGAQRRALHAVEGALGRARLPPLAWYDVLLELERAGKHGLRPFELQEATLLAQYNLSRLLDRLEKDSLVERRECPQDGRGQVVAIAAAGRTLRRRMWPVYAAAIKTNFADHLSTRQVASLDAVLGALNEKLRRRQA